MSDEAWDRIYKVTTWTLLVVALVAVFFFPGLVRASVLGGAFVAYFAMMLFDRARQRRRSSF